MTQFCSQQPINSHCESQISKLCVWRCAPSCCVNDISQSQIRHCKSDIASASRPCQQLSPMTPMTAHDLQSGTVFFRAKPTIHCHNPKACLVKLCMPSIPNICTMTWEGDCSGLTCLGSTLCHVWHVPAAPLPLTHISSLKDMPRTCHTRSKAAPFTATRMLVTNLEVPLPSPCCPQTMLKGRCVTSLGILAFPVTGITE